MLFEPENDVASDSDASGDHCARGGNYAVPSKKKAALTASAALNHFDLDWLEFYASGDELTTGVVGSNRLRHDYATGQQDDKKRSAECLQGRDEWHVMLSLEGLIKSSES